MKKNCFLIIFITNFKSHLVRFIQNRFFTDLNGTWLYLFLTYVLITKNLSKRPKMS